MAKIIRQNGKYSSSIVHKLDQILSSEEPWDRVHELLGGTQTQDDPSLELKSIILDCPSLDGKTQSAFIFDNVRPLYFALKAHTFNKANSSKTGIQPIYLNFEILNKAIEYFATIDLETTLLKGTDINNLSDSDYLKMTNLIIRNLDNKQQWTGFFTLGLIKNMIKDAESNYNDEDNWMLFYSNRPNLEVISVTITSMKQSGLPFAKYCLFLDEYVDEPWCVLIRMVSQAIGLNCVVATKQSRLTEPLKISKWKMESLASSDKSVSLVITNLKLTSLEVLNKYIGEKFNLEIAVKHIHNNLISTEYRHDKKHFNQFMSDFIKNQVTNLSPGIAIVAVKTIYEFSLQATEKCCFSDFLDHLIKKISTTISDRIPLLATTPIGISANMNLFFSHAFKDSGSGLKGPNRFYQQIMYMNSHLYRLLNPENHSTCAFLTCRSGNADKPLSFYSEKYKMKMLWQHEGTYFNSGEMLTMLSCFCLFPSSPSFRKTLEELEEADKCVPFKETDSPFVRKRLGLPPKVDELPGEKISSISLPAEETTSTKRICLKGNRLEVLATACILDASHRSPHTKETTFRGQNGICFFENILGNLVIETQDRFSAIEMNIVDSEAELFNLKSRLEDILVPYLYPSNLQVPDIFKSLALDEGSIRIGEFKSYKYDSDFNSSFQYYQKRSSHASTIDKQTCIIETKNWFKTVCPQDISKIIDNALDSGDHSKLCLIFCNRFVDPTPASMTNRFKSLTANILTMTTESQDVNIFGITKKAENSFDIAPFLKKGTHLHSNPRLICFIFELEEINKTSADIQKEQEQEQEKQQEKNKTT